MFFLSDRDGITRTYEFSLMGHRAVNVKEPIEQPHTHLTLDALNEDVIVARKVNGISNIYKITWDGIYIPLTDSNSFDGYPAGGPV